MKRVVVTGASGFIGAEAIRSLTALGYEVHCLGRRPAAEGIHHSCDLLVEDAAPILASIAPTHLLHLAWTAEPGVFWTTSRNLDWLAASLRLVRGFVGAGGRRAAFAGTCAEYDWSYSRLDEAATPLAPATLYGLAKVSLFRLLEGAAAEMDLSFAWGRIFFPYGPTEKAGRLLASVIDGVAANSRVACTDGSQLRDFLHVEDVGRAFAAILDSDVNGAINIASGEVTAVREVVRRAAERVGDASLVDFGARPMQPGEPLVMIASIERLVATGFRPRFALDAGLADTVDRRLSL